MALNPQSYLQANISEDTTGSDYNFNIWGLLGLFPEIDFSRIYYGTLSYGFGTSEQDVFDPYIVKGTAGRYNAVLSTNSINLGLTKSKVNAWLGTMEPSFNFYLANRSTPSLIANSIWKDSDRVIQFTATGDFDAVLGVSWAASGGALHGTGFGYGLIVFKNSDPTSNFKLSGDFEQGSSIILSGDFQDDDGVNFESVKFQWVSGIDIESVKFEWTKINPTTIHESTNKLQFSQDEVGKFISCKVSYTDLKGFEEAIYCTSEVSVTNKYFSPTGNVLINGKTSNGQVLTASNTLLDLDGVKNVTYKWYIEGSSTPIGTGDVYKLSSSEVGKAITVTATYIDGDNTMESVSSTPTNKISNTNFIPIKLRYWSNAISLKHDFGFIDSSSKIMDTSGSVVEIDLLSVSSLSPSIPPPPNATLSSVTLSDVLAALKLYLGKSEAISASPYKFLAADFDSSGSLSLNDVLGLLKFYLGKSVTRLPEWVYVEESNQPVAKNGLAYTKDNTSSPMVMFDGTETEINLVGVLRGDVDGSFGV